MDGSTISRCSADAGLFPPSPTPAQKCGCLFTNINFPDLASDGQVVFISNLERQMTDEQKAVWIPKAERFEILGSYAQTELSHGSNVRGLETTATFDRATDEFIINSPTVSSAEYWIGATGIWATHSIVVARLIIDGKEYGNHLFLTQLRDLETHKLLPGVEIYELGPKVFQGMVGVHNGAMQVHNVRIPRDHMLARNAQVLRDGTDIPPKNTKHSYGSMITVRAIMAEITGYDLLRASSSVPLYEFPVKYRLLPLLAKGTALVLVRQDINRAFDEYSELVIKTGNTSQLEDLHLQTVGAKVYSTDITANGVETCRIACGDHGYSALSGFGQMYAHTVNAVTYEGDNYVIAQQAPRVILKHYKAILRRPESSSKLNVSSESDWFEPDNQQWVLERRLPTLVKAHMEASDVMLVEIPVSLFTSSPWHIAISSTGEDSGILTSAYDKAIQTLSDFSKAIIDAYGFAEFEMDSALARAEMNPYEALVAGPKNSDMNNMRDVWPVDSRRTWAKLDVEEKAK
ncbi:acyl-CoA oxidase [Blastomyces dermatitidis ER-3]|uniref:Acyl-CoA oxidase n=1 Tax=Ajellomyces dermatitidis (strain ER-3 / ATCC MYA-2586) TaxID=559297 RepID=A0ABP2ERB0_AJEDR|nr:acyl-CoA oxidase [Blastomyces dermatitidis ER-3]EEQ85753.2 acyl-CoA oxidase [Blastomyces dermatitidis ER-3]